MGGVRGYGPTEEDDDLAGPLGRFGDTGGHRQDLDSAGAYVVAGPEGEDISHAIGAANANRHDPSFQTYVGVPAEDEAATLKGQRGRGGGGIGPEETLIALPAEEEAATLSAGGHPNSNDPGRKREDDVNLVTYAVHPGTVKTDGPNTLSAREVDEADSLSASDAKKSDRGTLVAEDAVGFLAGSSAKTGGVGAEDEVAPTMGSESNGSTRTPTVAYTKTHGATDTEDAELWEEAEEARPLESTAFATDVVVEEPQTFDWQVSGGGDSFRGKGRTWIEDKPGETRSLQTTKTLAVHEPKTSAVRRLTPTECERLQGFPDGWTLLPDEATSDGARYSALGDAVTVNVAFWIVRRLIRRRELGLE